jgi:hypothetical protein
MKAIQQSATVTFEDPQILTPPLSKTGTFSVLAIGLRRFMRGREATS